MYQNYEWYICCDNGVCTDTGVEAKNSVKFKIPLPEERQSCVTGVTVKKKVSGFCFQNLIWAKLTIAHNSLSHQTLKIISISDQKYLKGKKTYSKIWHLKFVMCVTLRVVTGVTKFPFGQVSVKLILDIPEIQVVVINFQNKLPRKAI